MKESFPVIDTHVHLEELSDPQAAIMEAKEGGVIGMVAVGQDITSNQKTMEIAGRNPGFVFPAVGYHPWRLNPDNDEETLQQIDANLDGCIALG